MQIVLACNQVKKFVDSLEHTPKSKVLRSAELIKMYGRSVGMPHVRQIDAELFELRVHDKQEVRIFFVYRDLSAVLLHGFVKKSMRLPDREIATARKRLLVFDGR